MSKTLATAVHLTDESGIVHSFLPGSTPPKWARKRIDNPKAWVESEDPDDDDTDADESPDTGDSAEGSVAESGDTSSDTEIPRKNASTDAWRAYADAKGFEVDDDVSRAEIIAALDAAGIPTE